MAKKTSEKTTNSELQLKPDLGPATNPRPGAITLGDKSPLDSMIVSKMRAGVFNKVQELYGTPFAEGNWEFMAHRIIAAANVIRYPDLYGRLMDQDQVGQMKKDFAAQLQYCEEIQKRLEAWMDMGQIKTYLGVG